MKKIFLAASFAALIATTAFAQPYGYDGPYFYGPYGYTSAIIGGDGRVIGRDPDPNVRLEVRRDSMLSDIYQ